MGGQAVNVLGCRDQSHQFQEIGLNSSKIELESESQVLSEGNRARWWSRLSVRKHLTASNNNNLTENGLI